MQLAEGTVVTLHSKSLLRPVPPQHCRYAKQLGTGTFGKEREAKLFIAAVRAGAAAGTAAAGYCSQFDASRLHSKP